MSSVRDECEELEEDEVNSTPCSLIEASKLTTNLENLSTNGFMSSLPKELELKPVLETGSRLGFPQVLTVTAKVDLKVGFRFGPYQGKTSKDPVANVYNWKVSCLTIYCLTVTFSGQYVDCLAYFHTMYKYVLMIVSF